MIAPLPEKFGYGFFTLANEYPEVEHYFKGYEVEQVGRYVNAHFTPAKWQWPHVDVSNGAHLTIDGFSPNLNKYLHVGHMRNMVLANAYHHMFPAAFFVAMLGTSLGEEPGARDTLLNYWKEIGYGVDRLYTDSELVALYKPEFEMRDGEGYQEGCKVWDGPEGPVIVVKSDGTPTYAYHDLLLHQVNNPTYYLTGQEQQSHFKSLGLLDKHLPMGLVVGTDGKKLKSRYGSAFLIEDAVTTMQDALAQHEEQVNASTNRELAWNILGFNLLSVSLVQQVTFDPERWSCPTSPGLYVAYTQARYKKIVDSIGSSTLHTSDLEDDNELMGLLAWTEYLWYYMHTAQAKMSTTPLTTYASNLARQMNRIYASRRILGGSSGLQFVVKRAYDTLVFVLQKLGLHILDEV